MLLASWWNNDLWYSLPLIVSISLVYAATRHESMRFILQHAARVAAWIVGLLAIALVVLMLASFGL